MYIPDTKDSDRLWIIGNGPSLKKTPLDLLSGEDTMALNRINWMWEKVNPELQWRPKFYFRIDWNEKDVDWANTTLVNHAVVEWSFLWEAFRDGSFVQHGRPHLQLSEAMGTGLGDLERVTWIPRCDKHHYYAWDNLYKGVKNWHLPTVCTALCSMHPMLQIASMMGYDEIYLVGCDLGFSDDLSKNHFHPDYQLRSDPRPISDRQNGATLYAHQIANRDSPVPIYNATIGGQLEVYPRVDIREVLK